MSSDTVKRRRAEKARELGATIDCRGRVTLSQIELMIMERRRDGWVTMDEAVRLVNFPGTTFVSVVDEPTMRGVTLRFPGTTYSHMLSPGLSDVLFVGWVVRESRMLARWQPKAATPDTSDTSTTSNTSATPTTSDMALILHATHLTGSEAREALCKLFSQAHVDRYVLMFPPDHMFPRQTYVSSYVDWINSLSEIR